MGLTLDRTATSPQPLSEGEGLTAIAKPSDSNAPVVEKLARGVQKRPAVSEPCIVFAFSAFLAVTMYSVRFKGS